MTAGSHQKCAVQDGMAAARNVNQRAIGAALIGYPSGMSHHFPIIGVSRTTRKGIAQGTLMLSGFDAIDL